MIIKLNDDHHAHLHAGGLTDETITQAGLYSATSEQVSEILGWSPRNVDWGVGLVFPYRLNGEAEAVYSRLKLDFPRSTDDGKVIKYETPKGTKNRVYFPPGVEDQLQGADTFVVTEGEKKSLAVSQHGTPCIGLAGVWAWQRRRKRTDTGRAYGKRVLIPDLAGIGWKGKRVVVAFDSDVVTNTHVQLAEARLSEVLSELGADVRVARIPAAGDDKVGIDDFLVAQDDPAEALHKLIDAAQPPETPPPPSPMDWARMFIDEDHTSPDGPTLRWYRDEFHAWDGRRYRFVPDAELVAILLQYLDERGGNAKPTNARDILKCIGSEIRVPFDVERPVYLGRTGAGTTILIAMDNGLLDLDAVLTGTAKLLPHTPKWFSPLALPYDFVPDAECPVWFRAMDAIFEGDEERVDLLGEWFGYCLTDDTRYHAIILMEGPPRSGKGTVLRTLQRVIGEDNCVAPRLSALSERFGLWSLLGKRVAICPDAHLGHGDRAMSVLEILKSISGEDAIDIDRKMLPPITARLRVRFALAVNELPKFGDNANALESRVLILPFRQSFVGREDRHLDDKIATESPGIFRWAIEGLHRLRARGRFTRPQMAAEVESDFARLVSPIRAFIEDRCIVEPTATVDRDELWAAWSLWCEESGHLRGSRELLGARLRAVLPSLGTTRPRTDAGRMRLYVGIDLRGEVSSG
ncbi:MAG: phage/plasmid primase, P4 family [Phycisphaerae bacterium]